MRKDFLHPWKLWSYWSLRVCTKTGFCQICQRRMTISTHTQSFLQHKFREKGSSMSKYLISNVFEGRSTLEYVPNCQKSVRIFLQAPSFCPLADKLTTCHWTVIEKKVCLKHELYVCMCVSIDQSVLRSAPQARWLIIWCTHLDRIQQCTPAF